MGIRESSRCESFELIFDRNLELLPERLGWLGKLKQSFIANILFCIMS